MPKKLEYKDVKQFFEDCGYELLSTEYNGNHSHLTVKCPHGHINSKVTFANFKRNIKNGRGGCLDCSGKKQLTYEQVKQELKSYGIELVSNRYENTSTKLQLKCEQGHVYESTLDNIRQTKRNRCPFCNGGVALKHNDVQLFVEQQGYVMLNTYKPNEKLHLICPNGRLYDVLPMNFIHKEHRCTQCKNTSSKGERKIYSLLHEHKIDFQTEYSFNGKCRNDLTNRPLPFDIYIESLNVCIEYDGEGHYKPIIRGKQTIEEATKEYNNIVYRDGLKNRFCEEYKIKLIRIPYWEYENIEAILKEQLF